MDRRFAIWLCWSFFILSLIPIIAPLFFSVAFLMKSGKFYYDFLMPAELFLFTVIGASGMIILAKLGKIHDKSVKILFILLILTVLNVLFSQIYANLTGLARGETELAGIHLFMIVVFVILYHFFAISVAVETFILLKVIGRNPSVGMG